MTNLVLFAMGLVIAVPAGIVIVGLVLSSAADERERQDPTFR